MDEIRHMPSEMNNRKRVRDDGQVHRCCEDVSSARFSDTDAQVQSLDFVNGAHQNDSGSLPWLQMAPAEWLEGDISAVGNLLNRGLQPKPC